MTLHSTVLILGGTADARALAGQLTEQGGWRVITSLAGRTTAPMLPAGEVISGGFGGADGLAAYLRQNHIARVIDATHPFAARMGWNAAQACATTGTPLLRLERPAWSAGPGDCWIMVDAWTQAAEWLAQHAHRVLLALGRQDLQTFAGLDHIRFVIRAVDAPAPSLAFTQAEIVLARGPFSLDDEIALLHQHRIDAIVCKNSGGSADAKLLAARQLGIPVVMRNRPPRPDGARVFTRQDVLAWLDQPMARPTTTP